MSNMRKTRDSVSVFMLGARLGKAEFADYLRCLDTALDAGEPFAMVIDATSPEFETAEAPNPRWQLKRAATIGKLHRGIAFVTGTMTRERVRALYALQPPGVPYAFFGERAEAVAWAREALDGEERTAIGERKTVPLMNVVQS
jgi:hypothetical protein